MQQNFLEKTREAGCSIIPQSPLELVKQQLEYHKREIARLEELQTLLSRNPEIERILELLGR